MSKNRMLDGEDILVITEGFWDSPKRIRHKMPMQWARAGCRVLWIEQCPFPPGDLKRSGRLKQSLTGDLREVMPGLFVGAMPPALPRMYKSGVFGDTLKYLHGPAYYRRLHRHIHRLKFNPRLVVLFQQAARRDVFYRFSDSLRIYYHHDVYGYGYATPAQERALVDCCRSADMVWCVAKEHRDELIQHNPNTHHIPHAVDSDWFTRHAGERPAAYDTIPEPRAVYTGVFQDKMDLPLLIEVASRRPEWQFVFVGPVQPKNLDAGQIETLRARPNVHFLGERDVNELPGFMAGATVLMLPYMPNDNMKSAGLSLKFYEYLVSGKPVVIAPYTTMQMSEDYYYLARDAAAWGPLLDRLEKGESAELVKKRIEEAARNTYDARLDTQRGLIEACGIPKKAI